MIFAICTIAIVAISLVYALICGELLRRRDRELERVIAAAARERAELLDRLMYMARTPWNSPAPEPEYETPYIGPEFVYPETGLVD